MTAAVSNRIGRLGHTPDSCHLCGLKQTKATVNHPDEKELPAYIDKLLTPSGVEGFAEWLKEHHPESFAALKHQLKQRYRDVNRKKGSSL